MNTSEIGATLTVVTAVTVKATGICTGEFDDVEVTKTVPRYVPGARLPGFRTPIDNEVGAVPFTGDKEIHGSPDVAAANCTCAPPVSNSTCCAGTGAVFPAATVNETPVGFAVMAGEPVTPETVKV